MTEPILEGRAALDEVLGRARRVVALTGAGISTECGVPDFRSPDSPWRRYPPIPFAEWVASADARAEAWRRKFIMDDIYAGAKPGRTHRALTHMAARGRLRTVVTQNIDGLHQAADLPADRLVELHGNGGYAHCLTCGLRYDLVPLRRAFEASGVAPDCGCGGMVKAASIAFGQALPPDILRRAADAVLDCDLLLALGSSLVVKPAATLPLLARKNGAVLAIVNREPTPLDRAADLVVRGDVGDLLAPRSESF